MSVSVFSLGHVCRGIPNLACSHVCAMWRCMWWSSILDAARQGPAQQMVRDAQFTDRIFLEISSFVQRETRQRKGNTRGAVAQPLRDV